MIDALDQISPRLAQHFPPHYVRERADWVGTYGHGDAAMLRQQRLAARARRGLRAETGTGDGAVSEDRVKRRLGRRLATKDRKVRGAMSLGLVELMRLVAFGPALALGWAIYAVLYQRVPARGPLRWRHLSGAAAAVALATVLALLWTTSPTSLAGLFTWWLVLQVPLGVAYASRLAWLWGWEAVTRAVAVTAAPAPAEIEIEIEGPPRPARTTGQTATTWSRIKAWMTEETK